MSTQRKLIPVPFLSRILTLPGDTGVDEIAGVITIDAASDAATVDEYTVYYGKSTTVVSTDRTMDRTIDVTMPP